MLGRSNRHVDAFGFVISDRRPWDSWAWERRLICGQPRVCKHGRPKSPVKSGSDRERASANSEEIDEECNLSSVLCSHSSLNNLPSNGSVEVGGGVSPDKVGVSIWG